jgi:hypothetical protein
MKKAIFVLTIVMVMCGLFTLPAFADDDDNSTPVLAAEGSSFENAIRLTLQPGDERGSPLEDFKYTEFTLDYFEQSVYFVFTPDKTDTLQYEWTGQISFHLYDDRFNPILGDNEVQRGNTYYLRVEFRGNEAAFNRDAPINAEISVILYTPERQLGAPWMWITLFLGFLFVVAFPYRRYMLKKYEFDPIEKKPLFISFGLVVVYSLLMWFAGLGAMWPLMLAMLPSIVITTLKLIKITKDPKILAINTVLMLGFYGMMAFIAVMVFFLLVMIAFGYVLFFYILPMVLRSGGGGSKSNPYGPGIDKVWTSSGYRHKDDV